MSLYEILGVNKNATKTQIRRAYLKLAKKYHPDKQGGDTKKMQDIQFAYDTLSDSDKREKYDLTGDTSTTGAPPDAKFIQYIYGQIDPLLDSMYDDTNMVQKLREITHRLINSTQDKMTGMQLRIRTIQGVKDKFYVTGDGDNLFAGIFDSKIKEIEKNILLENDNIRAFQGFYQMLDNYGYGDIIKTAKRNYKKETQDYANGLFNDLTTSNKYQRNGNMAASEIATHLASCSKEFSYRVESDKIVVTHIASGEVAETNKFNIA